MKNIVWEKYPQIEDSENTYDDSHFIMTPHGVLPLSSLNPNKIFNFWIMHSNFLITPQIKQCLMNILGVETLEILTPYRARIAIGKAFDDFYVKSEIEKLLTIPKKVVDVKLGMEKLISQISNKYPYWAIVMNEEKELDTYGGKVESEVQNQVSRSSGTVIACSWASGNDTTKV